MSGAELRRVLKTHGITQKDAAEAAGVPQTTLSGWCNSRNVDDIKAELLLEAVGIGAESKVIQKPVETIETLSVEQVAAIWGVSPATIRSGIQQGVFCWAYAIRTSENRWTYLINADKFRKTEVVHAGKRTLHVHESA